MSEPKFRTGREAALAILKDVDWEKVFKRLLKSKDDRVVLDTLMFLTDHALGVPPTRRQLDEGDE
jgi:hypothetical protein